MPGIVIKPRSPIFHGHEWIYSYEIQKTFGDPQPGSIISLKDVKDRPLGTAIYNPKAPIVARRFSRRKQKLEPEFFKRRISQAIELRHNLEIDSKLCRLVASDADALPGIIIDRYADHLILQIQTLAMLPHQQEIADALQELISPRSITLFNHAPALAEEGIPPETISLSGSLPSPFQVETNGTKFEIDLSKNDDLLPLDLLDTQAKITSAIKNNSVLNCFSDHGTFAIPAALAGSTVTAVNSNSKKITALKRLAEINKTSLNIQEHDPFHFLKHCEDTFEHIILTPPCLAPTKKSVANALRTYREIHVRALKLLNRGGTLTTICYSNHLTREQFLENIVSSSVEAKRSIRLTASHSQRNDHPILPAIPETQHLVGFSLQLTPSR